MILALSVSFLILGMLLASLTQETAERLGIASSVVAISVLPRLIVSAHANVRSVVGIAPPVWSLMTYQVVILLSLAFWMSRRGIPASVPIPFLAFIVLIIASTLLSWGATAANWSGVWDYSIAVLAWPLGAATASFVHRSTGNTLFLLKLLLAVLVLQGAVSLVQLSGASLPIALTAAPNDVLYGTSRVTGTLGNPANLSKVTFFFLVLTLPFTLSDRIDVRRYAYGVASLSVVITAMTVSRANLLAVGLTGLAWIVLAPSRLKLGRRMVLLLGGGCLLALTSGSTVARFVSDPEGGPRPQLLNTALHELPSSWLGGVGVNSYVRVVGMHDPLTAADGLPVHNLYLLQLIEVGILPTLLFLLPIAHLIWRSAKNLSVRSESGYSRVVLASVPGFLAISMTGYGLLASFVLPALLWLCGYLRFSIESDLSAPGPDDISVPTSRHRPRAGLVGTSGEV